MVSNFEFYIDELMENIKEADIPEYEASKIYHEIEEFVEYWKDKDYEAFDTQHDTIQTLLSGVISKATFPDGVIKALESLHTAKQTALGEVWDKGTKEAQKTEFEKMLGEQFMIR